MRARTIKPEFFTDRKIGLLGCEAAAVYVALWTAADDGGVARCDPDRLKGEMFWAWPSLDVATISDALDALDGAGRIERYQVGDDTFCFMPTFGKHQNPHNPSTFRFPRPGDDPVDASVSGPRRGRPKGSGSGSGKPASAGSDSGAGSRVGSGVAGEDSANGSRTTADDVGNTAAVLPQDGRKGAETGAKISHPVSLIPSPKSRIPKYSSDSDESDQGKRADPQVDQGNDQGDGDRQDVAANPFDAGFDDFWQVYPKRKGSSKQGARKAWRARRREGHTVAKMLDGARGYAKFIQATNRAGTEFVKLAETFLGPGLHFESDWTPPASSPAPRANGSGPRPTARDRTLANLQSIDAADGVTNPTTNPNLPAQ